MAKLSENASPNKPEVCHYKGIAKDNPHITKHKLDPLLVFILFSHMLFLKAFLPTNHEPRGLLVW